VCMSAALYLFVQSKIQLKVLKHAIARMLKYALTVES
jgi:hypothetical protein